MTWVFEALALLVRGMEVDGGLCLGQCPWDLSGERRLGYPAGLEPGQDLRNSLREISTFGLLVVVVGVGRCHVVSRRPGSDYRFAYTKMA